MGSQATVVAEPLAQPLNTNLCWMLSRASHVLHAELTAALEALGVSPRAHCVLGAAMKEPLTQVELGRSLGVDKTTMVVTLDELEAAGLAERRRSTTDRRARVIAVTEAGEDVVREAERIIDRIHADVLAALPEEDRDAFVDALARLVGGRLREPAIHQRN